MTEEKEPLFFPLHWLKSGLKYKYPLCCIFHFIFSPKRILKINTIIIKDGYNPCLIHRFMLMKKYKINNRQLELIGSNVKFIKGNLYGRK